jgi:hypothetical protein
MRILTATFAKLSLVAALLVALASTDFAHRAIPLDVDDNLMRYLAVGGSLGEICGDASGDHVGQSCDACRLVDVASVPSASAQALSADWHTGPALPVFVGLCPAGSVADPARPVRAPPVV